MLLFLNVSDLRWFLNSQVYIPSWPSCISSRFIFLMLKNGRIVNQHKLSAISLRSPASHSSTPRGEGCRERVLLYVCKDTGVILKVWVTSHKTLDLSLSYASSFLICNQVTVTFKLCQGCKNIFISIKDYLGISI